MYMLKLLFQKLQIRPSWLLGKQLTSWGTAKDDRPGTTGGFQAFGIRGQTDDHPPLGTANCPGQERCSFFHLIIPASQSPHHTLFIPWYKNIGLERKKQDGRLGYEPAIFSDLRPSE